MLLLPPYSPQFKAAERIWRYTRKETTLNHYVATFHGLCDALGSTFADIHNHPENIEGLLIPFL